MSTSQATPSAAALNLSAAIDKSLSEAESLAAEINASRPAPTTPAEKSELDRLREENAALKAKLASGTVRTIRFKVAENTKALSVYGINSFKPVTLYAGQWLRLLPEAKNILTFIQAHKSELAWK